MNSIQIDFSTENTFSQNQQTRTLPLAKLPKNTEVLQEPVSAPSHPKNSFQKIFSARDNVQISSSAQFIQQNTKTSFLQNSGNSPAGTHAIALQNGTLSLIQNNSAITSTYYRNNGSQFQFSINQNVSLQENEDYSASIFFEQENISKKYHADGKISQYQGNILDENKKSVHINSKGGTINANNDTIFALADKTSIRAKGNNTIILKENMHDVHINARDGDNTIIGQEIENAAISLANGKNTLNLKSADNSTVNAQNSNVQLNTGKLVSSTINLEKGTHSINLQESLHNSIQFESNSFNQESKLNIFGKTQNTLIHAAGEKVSLNLQNSKNNYIESTAKFTNAKFYHSNNDAVNIEGYSGNISAGALSDTTMKLQDTQAASLHSNVIAGNSNIAVSGRSASLFAHSIKDNSAVLLNAEHFSHTQIQTVSDTAAVDINSAYYNTVTMGTLKDNTHTNIMGDGTIAVNALNNNAGLNLGTGVTHVGIGSISGNAVLQGGENALQIAIGKNADNKIAESSPAYAPAPVINSKEQTRALTSYIKTANNFKKMTFSLQNQMPLNRLV